MCWGIRVATTRALVDERVRELRQQRIGELPRYAPRARRPLAETKRTRTTAVRAKCRTDLSSALAAAVCHLRRRVDPHRS